STQSAEPSGLCARNEPRNSVQVDPDLNRGHLNRFPPTAIRHREIPSSTFQSRPKSFPLWRPNKMESNRRISACRRFFPKLWKLAILMQHAVEQSQLHRESEARE